MSHSITITRTTTTSTDTGLYLNCGYIRSFPGLLKLAELFLGAACVGVMGYYWDRDYTSRYNGQKPEFFYMLVAVTFFINTFCLLSSYIVSFKTASFVSRTSYEVIYHGLAFILYLAAGLTLLLEVNHRKNDYNRNYDPYLAASIMGLVMSGLYLLSTILANRQTIHVF